MRCREYRFPRRHDTPPLGNIQPELIHPGFVASFNQIPNALVHAECIGDAPHFAGTVHRHDIESDAGLAPMGIFTKQNFGGTHKPCLLARLQGRRRSGEILAGFDLDKNGQAIALHDGIDFPCRSPQAPAENIKPVPHQCIAGQLFCCQSGCELRHAHGETPSKGAGTVRVV